MGKLRKLVPLLGQLLALASQRHATIIRLLCTYLLRCGVVLCPQASGTLSSMLC